jgi:ABC-type branched-subunit amino acid transport system ATPase component
VPQGNNIFPNLTVYENLEIASAVLRDRARAAGAMKSVLDKFPFSGKRRNKPARILSGGERQILALSRILILKPLLALLDEPSLGLAPLLVDVIFEEMAEMNRGGISLLLVEQNARKALAVSHRGYVLELGRNRITGTGKNSCTIRMCNGSTWEDKGWRKKVEWRRRNTKDILHIECPPKSM